jgi:uncharacterized repeat protein (TIGR04052 family)
MLRLTVAFAAATLAGGCGSEMEGDLPIEVSLRFRATVGGLDANCSSTYSGIGSSGAQVQLADARLFVSQLEARRSSDGSWAEIELDETLWQRNGVALLDFEDGTGACADSGTAARNTAITGTVAAGSYDGVRFRVGVPFALNHIDNATAAPPFNVPGMYWAWQGGYKFLRVDWLVERGAVARWNIHLGSTGCVSAAPTEPPGYACARPNTPAVELGPLDLASATVDVDLAALVAGADLSSNGANTPPGCMSGHGEPGDCPPVFAALGLSFADGGCVQSCAGQVLFSAR